MGQKDLLKKSALAVSIALLSSNLYAAGFQLNEYSTSGLGRSFAGEGAIADNAAVGSRNPAAMMMFDRPTASAGATLINPHVSLSGKTPTTLGSRNLKADDIAPSALVPNAHFIYPINEQWAVGTSATTNFGLSTRFNDTYPAGPQAGETKLTTINLNLSAAYRLDDNFSFGVGFNALRADAKLIRYAGDLALISGALPVGASSNTEVGRLEGDKWGYGWNVGLLYELNKDHRFALTYRSKIDVKFKGDYSGVSAPGQGKVPGNLDLNLPEVWEFSGYNKLASQWALHYGATYTTWSRFQELKATGSSGNVLFEKQERFRDAYRLGVGTTYYHDDNWTFRTGVAFDKSPATDRYRSISIPDQDRVWLSVGTTYAFTKEASVDLGLSYMQGMKVKIKEQLVDGNSAIPTYNFDAKGRAWLYGVNFNYTF